MPKTRFGLIGAGAIGNEIANAFRKREIHGELVAVYDVDEKKAEKLAEKTPGLMPTPTFEELLSKVDFVIEAASQKAVKEHIPKAIKSGKSVLIMSVGALMDSNFLKELKKTASDTWARVYLPSGAVAGIDALLAASSGGIKEVTLTSTKPPQGLKDVEYIRTKGIDLEKITKPIVVYDGKASEAVTLFTKNINVSAIVSLAAGMDIRVKIVADPTAKTNMHEIHAIGAFGEMTTKTSNVASPTNPKTSYLAALSAIATLKKVSENIRIGN